MSVEKLLICSQWQLYVALFTDVTNLKELRQSVINGQFDVALISPRMVCMCVTLARNETRFSDVG